MSLLSVLKKAEKESLATINAAQTMLNRFPALDTNSFSLSAGTSTNPFPFLLELLKSTAGYDYVIRAIGSLIATAIPVMEVTVKTILLTNLRSLISCSFDPFIPNDLLKNGMIFPLDRLDVLGILEHSPMRGKVSYDPDAFQDSKYGAKDIFAGIMTGRYAQKHSPGSYYYFGVDNFDTPDELKNAGDFNAFMWYVKHRAPTRVSWHGVKLLQATVGDSSYGDMRTGKSWAQHRSRGSYCAQKQPKTDDYADKQTTNVKKDKKGAGIITLEYRDNATSFMAADGTNIDETVIPYTNAIHVTIGCTEPRGVNYEEMEKAERNYQNALVKFDKINGECNNLNAEINKMKAEYQKNQSANDNEKSLSAIDKKVKEYDEKVKKLEEQSKELNKARTESEKKRADVMGDLAGDEFSKKCIPITQNYYYGRTLAEFNYDYITSLKLFDAKVIVAMLLDSLTGCFNLEFGVNVSYERKVIQEEVTKIVEAIVESDEATISDCFFTFTNEGYAEMMRKVELMQAGLMTDRKGRLKGRKAPSAEDILAGVDKISSDSDEEEVVSVINSSLFKASASITENNEEDGPGKLKVDGYFNFIEQILTGLASVIVTTLITPKVYLLLAVNLKVLDKEEDFSMKGFIENNKNMIAAMIRSVRDIIIGFLFEQIKSLIIDLAVGEAKLIAQEQADMYKRLLRQCLECFRSHGRNQDFSVDNVNYADILKPETDADSDTKNNNC